MEWLTNHLGHKVDTHTQYYRLHESTVELAKVSRLLMAVDEGKIGEYHGRKLKDIEFDEIADEGN